MDTKVKSLCAYAPECRNPMTKFQAPISQDIQTQIQEKETNHALLQKFHVVIT
jgi:hypothetical protein